MAFECEVLGGMNGFDVLHGASAFDGTDVVTLLITEACHTSCLPLQWRLGCHLHRLRIAQVKDLNTQRDRIRQSAGFVGS